MAVTSRSQFALDSMVSQSRSSAYCYIHILFPERREKRLFPLRFTSLLHNQSTTQQHHRNDYSTREDLDYEISAYFCAPQKSQKTEKPGDISLNPYMSIWSAQESAQSFRQAASRHIDIQHSWCWLGASSLNTTIFTVDVSCKKCTLSCTCYYLASSRNSIAQHSLARSSTPFRSVWYMTPLVGNMGVVMY